MLLYSSLVSSADIVVISTSLPLVIHVKGWRGNALLYAHYKGWLFAPPTNADTTLRPAAVPLPAPGEPFLLVPPIAQVSGPDSSSLPLPHDFISISSSTQPGSRHSETDRQQHVASKPVEAQQLDSSIASAPTRHPSPNQTRSIAPAPRIRGHHHHRHRGQYHVHEMLTLAGPFTLKIISVICSFLVKIWACQMTLCRCLWGCFFLTLVYSVNLDVYSASSSVRSSSTYGYSPASKQYARYKLPSMSSLQQYTFKLVSLWQWQGNGPFKTTSEVMAVYLGYYMFRSPFICSTCKLYTSHIILLIQFVWPTFPATSGKYSVWVLHFII